MLWFVRRHELLRCVMVCKAHELLRCVMVCKATWAAALCYGL